MVPTDFANFFLGSAGAGAALIGLLFVAISIAPEQTVMEGASMQRRAVAASAFTALVNAFFISMAALIPRANLGWTAAVMSILSLSNTVILGLALLRERSENPRIEGIVRGAVMIVISLILYILELIYSLQLLYVPANTDPIYYLTGLLLGVYGLALLRAWELLGARRYSLLSWLNPLRPMQRSGSVTQRDQPGNVEI